MSEARVNNLSNESNTGGPSISGITTFSSPYFFVPPKGDTASRPENPENGSLRFNTDSAKLEYFRGDSLGWVEVEASHGQLGGGTGSNVGAGTRALFIGGFVPTTSQDNTIDYVTISTLGDAQDFGDSTIKVFQDATCSSRVRSFAMGGSGPGGQIKEIATNVFSSLGNATDFGDLSDLNYGNQGISDATRGISYGGEGPSPSAGLNLIEYFTMASTGTVQDFGDLNRLTISSFSAMNSTRGLIIGGRAASPVAALYNTIDYITIQTTGTVTDFGDLYLAVSQSGHSGSICNGTRGFVVGGYNHPTSPSTSYNVIQYVTTATLGNSQDFGDTITTRGGPALASSPTRGVMACGFNPSLTNTIEYVELTSFGNSVDFGTATKARRTVGGASNGHGGL
tara:strand:- start:1142 stop:2329 length:1188 start_codon:yes stop_codon:yes gene_type:complete